MLPYKYDIHIISNIINNLLLSLFSGRFWKQINKFKLDFQSSQKVPNILQKSLCFSSEQLIWFPDSQALLFCPHQFARHYLTSEQPFPSDLTSAFDLLCLHPPPHSFGFLHGHLLHSDTTIHRVSVCMQICQDRPSVVVWTCVIFLSFHLLSLPVSIGLGPFWPFVSAHCTFHCKNTMRVCVDLLTV